MYAHHTRRDDPAKAKLHRELGGVSANWDWFAAQRNPSTTNGTSVKTGVTRYSADIHVICEIGCCDPTNSNPSAAIKPKTNMLSQKLAAKSWQNHKVAN